MLLPATAQSYGPGGEHSTAASVDQASLDDLERSVELLVGKLTRR